MHNDDGVAFGFAPMQAQSGPCVLPMHSQSGPFFSALSSTVFGLAPMHSQSGPFWFLPMHSQSGPLLVLPMHSQSGPCVLPMHSQSGPSTAVFKRAVALTATVKRSPQSISTDSP